MLSSNCICCSIDWSGLESGLFRSNQKMLSKACMLTSSFEIVTREATLQNPFLEHDDQDQATVDEEAQALIDQFQLDNTCSSNDLASYDHDLACCVDLSNEHWERTFFLNLVLLIARHFALKAQLCRFRV